MFNAHGLVMTMFLVCLKRADVDLKCFKKVTNGSSSSFQRVVMEI